MKALLAGALLAAAGVAAADGTWEAPERLRQAVERHARAQAPAGAQVQVALDPNLQLPRCGAEPAVETGAGSARGAYTATLSCTGPSPWKLYVPVRVLAYAEVLVVARPLPRGHALSADSVRAERRELGSLPLGYFTDLAAAQGMTLRRALAPGMVLSPGDVQAAAMVSRGQQVTLLVRGEAMEIRAQGKALAEGALNQRIPVQNLSSRRVVEGVVRSAGVVEVAF
ncbi:MAG: flagellar basal body P-ring formation protein FlgA [Gammaproteobacteria bacterium]|nr:flagellar basal body P-ring formation protein FlgA [Gammaproteobacteria bacterium]